MTESRWSKARVNAWAAEQGWLVGCNFIPSTASNQFEMWQQDTFDPETISRELAWASVVLLGGWYQDERRRFTRGPTVQDRHLQPSGITIFFTRIDRRIATARLK